MNDPVAELRSFLRAALVTPAPREVEDPPAVQRRRRVVAAITYAVGAVTLAATLRITPGDERFYLAALALAGVWALGAVLSGPLHLGSGHTRAGGQARPVVQSLALGVLLLGLFLAGAVVVARVPVLREPVDELLDHARFGSVPVVLAITMVNGVVEELYFRGALYSAFPRTHAVAATTVLYALTTVGSGVPLLVLAAVLLGVVTALQRRVTGGVLGPIITHITWSSGMLLLLPPVLELAR
jgi:membrane protease YdiL (CAAX protease family)